MDRLMVAYRSLVKIRPLQKYVHPLFAYDFLAERHSISKIRPPWQQWACSVPRRLFSRWYGFFFYKESTSMFWWFDKHAVAVAMEGWSCKSPSSWNALPSSIWMRRCMGSSLKSSMMSAHEQCFHSKPLSSFCHLYVYKSKHKTHLVMCWKL